MNKPAHSRHDISNKLWSLLKPHLPGSSGSVGRPAFDNRRFINAVFWILRTGAPWRDKGLWEKLLDLTIDDPDYEWLMIDASHCKVHPHAAGARGGNQDMSRTKGGSTPKYIWPWMRMVCRLESLSQKVPERIAKKLQG